VQLSTRNDAVAIAISPGAQPNGFRNKDRADSYNSSLGGAYVSAYAYGIRAPIQLVAEMARNTIQAR